MDQISGNTQQLSFEEIARNLLVYLKGQVPSLQTKTSKEDVARQIQAMAYYVRTTIMQLESAAYRDIKSTEEYKELLQQLEVLKKTNQRLEEALFVEMSKTQSLSQELDELKKNRSLSPSKENEYLQKINELENQLQTLNIELSNLRENANIQVLDLKSKLEEKVEEANKLKTLLEDLSKEYQQLKEENLLLKSEIDKLNNKLHQVEIQGVLTKFSNSSSVSDSYSNKVKVLEEEVAKLKSLLDARPTNELLQNLQATANAKISYLESSLAEWKKKAEDLALLVDQAPAQIETLKRQKLELEQRLIDMEATIRRLNTARDKIYKENASKTPSLRLEEYVFFFEIFSSLMLRLNKSPENKDLRLKSEQAISILEKNRIIQIIPTIGSYYDEKLHKVVKCFHSDILEDSTIIHEVSKGYKTSEYVIQRAVVWIVKSKFICLDCKNQVKVHEVFCSKCGMEICAPDGTPKRKLEPLTTNVEICIPLLDQLIIQNRIKEAINLYNYLLRDNPDNIPLQKRKTTIDQFLLQS